MVSFTSSWTIFLLDPLRELVPRAIRDFGLRGSVCAGLTGRIGVNATQVRVSSNRLEGLVVLTWLPAAAVRSEKWETRSVFQGSFIAVFVCRACSTA